MYTNGPGPQAQEQIPLGAIGIKNESDGCLLVTNSLSEKCRCWVFKKIYGLIVNWCLYSLLVCHAKDFIIAPQSLLLFVVTPALAQHISPSPLSPGRAVPTFTCMHCCLIISPLSGEQAAFSLALFYKYLRGQIPRRENYLVWYEEENGMERRNGHFRLRLERKHDSKASS